MAYKISGAISETVRIIIMNESDWSVAYNKSETQETYNIGGLSSGKKLVIARKSDGEVFGYANIDPSAYSISSGRGLFFSGWNGAASSNTIEHISISTTGNATDLCDLSQHRAGAGAASNGVNDRGLIARGLDANDDVEYLAISYSANAYYFGELSLVRRYLNATSNGTSDRAVFGGGWNGGSNYYNTLDYVTISSSGDAVNFGDLSILSRAPGATSNGTNNRGIFTGGFNEGGAYDIIDYITISSTGDANDFGDLTATRRSLAALSNGTNNRGVFGGGNTGGVVNIIEYITITSLGNATNFGDLTVGREYFDACSNGTSNRGVFGGGRDSGAVNSDVMDYVTITSIGDATDFGDLTYARYFIAATSNA